MAELKPCPFCGGEIQALGTEKEAAEAWNRRANECDRDELLEVADEIEADAEHIAEYLDSCEGNFTKDDAGEYYKLAGWHDRIRKALGVEELKPCPFCGGEAEIMEYSDRFQCGCKDGCCIAWVEEMPVYLTRSGAIKDWNTRAERTCEIVDSENKFVNWECSACGKEIKYSDNYCPNCGAKVIDDANV